jgi:hypothetical protein
VHVAAIAARPQSFAAGEQIELAYAKLSIADCRNRHLLWKLRVCRPVLACEPHANLPGCRTLRSRQAALNYSAGRATSLVRHLGLALDPAAHAHLAHGVALARSLGEQPNAP